MIYNCICLIPQNTLSLQDYALDFQALSMAFAATMGRPLQTMSRHKPPSQVGIWKSYVLIGVMVMLFTSTDVITMWYLTSRSWYTGGNGSAKHVRICFMKLLCSCFLAVVVIVLPVPFSFSTLLFFPSSPSGSSCFSHFPHLFCYLFFMFSPSLLLFLVSLSL